MTKTSRSLKSENMKWLVMLATFDAVCLVGFAIPELVSGVAPGTLTIARTSLTAAAPVLVLLLTGSMSSDFKASLVFWRWNDPLPSSEAFSRYAHKDQRVDVAGLERKLGMLPSVGREQSAAWYRLYREHADATPVAENHKLFLLYRDMAAMTLPLIVVVPAVLLWLGSTTRVSMGALLLLLLQFFAAVAGARHNGVRMVCTVLALSSEAPKAPRKAGKTAATSKEAGA